MSDERKPVWEQQWSRDADRIYVDTDDGSDVLLLQSYEQLIAPEGERYPHDYFPCAKLASAAPDMARALLAIEWSGQDRDCGSCCPSCEALGPSVFWNRKVGEPHLPDCALDAALRKAGVRT